MDKVLDVKKNAKKPSKKRTVRRQVDVYRERFVSKQHDATAEQEKFQRASTRELMVNWKTLMKSARETLQYIVAMLRERVKEIWVITQADYDRLLNENEDFDNEALFKIVCKFTSDDPNTVQPITITGAITRVDTNEPIEFTVNMNGIDVTDMHENALDQINALMSRSKKNNEPLPRKSAQEKRVLVDQFIALLGNLLFFHDDGIRREQFMGDTCCYVSADVLKTHLRSIIF